MKFAKKVILIIVILLLIFVGVSLLDTSEEAGLVTVKHSLGVETHDGSMGFIVRKNSALPLSNSRVFSTSEDYQTAVQINVFQGEKTNAADNVLIGSMVLENIELELATIPEIEVTFSINEEAEMSVTAKDLNTGNLKEVCFEPSGEKIEGRITIGSQSICK